jgi:hypothetical protein
MKASYLLLGAALLATGATGRTLDPSQPADAVEISKRAQCGAADGVAAVYHWSGKVYSRVRGEPDRHLFNGEGMNIRQCESTVDPKRGRGWRMVSREIMLYLDPTTGEVVRNWKNPWTGETVPVFHIANDPVNSRGYTFPIGADGKPYKADVRRQGRWMFMPVEVPLFYRNPLAGDYQEHVGGDYHAMEIFDFVFDAAEMLDTKNPTAYPSVAWVRISEWMPWMKMRGRDGGIVINAVGAKLKSFNELPAVLRTEIATNYPAYTAPPPLDDKRPNETTWTVFKKRVDAERAKAGPAPERR